MLRATLLLGLVTTVLVLTFAVQEPLGPSLRWQDEYHSGAILGDGKITEWSVDKLPNPSTTDHLVFETVYSLLQHWPNTRMRNGHNIVPGSIPKGTLLYHGSVQKEFPSGPEWVATDPEHSYFFCRNGFNHSQQGCWHLTLATTRPLKVVYFDGSSAAKLPHGSLDTQDLIAWGRVGNGDMADEKQRIRDLCKWGENFGVDGFVRMEMDFEVMLCDFTSGVRVVSSANLVSGGVIIPTIPVMLEAVNAGSWHNRFPGETRVQLDLSGLVSFYDTQLAPSLIPIRAGQERWDHRARNVSQDDLLAVKSRLEAALIRPEGLSSGIDWTTLVQVIVDRYSERLELTRYLLNSSATDPDELVDLASKTQNQLRIMLTPYLLLSATPTGSQSDKTELDWAIPTYKLCATTHTYFMESELNSMTDAEKLLLKAVRGTSREICRVVTKMWAAGVYAGIDPLLNTKESVDISEISHLWNTWVEDLNRLMAWLDWAVWVKCNPGCGPEEVCYLPTWPIGFPKKGWDLGRKSPSPLDPDGPHPEKLTSFDFRTMIMESLVEELSNTIQPGPDEWIRPQPKCVRRVIPYKL